MSLPVQSQHLGRTITEARTTMKRRFALLLVALALAQLAPARSEELSRLRRPLDDEVGGEKSSAWHQEVETKLRKLATRLTTLATMEGSKFGAGGTVRIKMKVLKTGKIESVEITGPSGSPTFDREVVRMLREEDPLPPVPPQSSGKPFNAVTLNFPVTMRRPTEGRLPIRPFIRSLP